MSAASSPFLQLAERLIQSVRDGNFDTRTREPFELQALRRSQDARVAFQLQRIRDTRRVQQQIRNACYHPHRLEAASLAFRASPAVGRMQPNHSTRRATLEMRHDCPVNILFRHHRKPLLYDDATHANLSRRRTEAHRRNSRLATELRPPSKP